MSGGPRDRRRHPASMPGARLRVLLGVQAPDGVQGGLLQALQTETPRQAGGRVQVSGDRVRIREQAERALQATHGEATVNNKQEGNDL